MGIVLFVPPIRANLDRVKLALPIVRPTECDLSVNRFFKALNLIYSTGGMRVETMIQLAARSVDNRVIRGDLLQAAGVIEAGGTIADAFRVPGFIAEEYKNNVATGEEAGKLQQAFDIIARLTEQAMEQRLNRFNAVFQRLVTYSVVLSIAGTALWIAGL